jgi:multidrug efflux pump subunit AcrA (membrane-fusion protein)
LPKGVVSIQGRQDKKSRYEDAQAQLKAAEARVNLDRANLDRVAVMMQFKRITAPYDGVIIERHTDIGDLVTADIAANTTPLFRIAQYDQIRCSSMSRRR